MIVKNKTNYTQTVRLPDGSVATARPLRTIDLEETIAKELDSNIWETQAAEKTTKKGK